MRPFLPPRESFSTTVVHPKRWRIPSSPPSNATRSGVASDVSICLLPKRRAARPCECCSQPRWVRAEGHIGAANRWFAGTKHDEIEALCIELLKKIFHAAYADHRLMGSMLGNLAVYQALTAPGDVIMSAAQPVGGHSSNRIDGPPACVVSGSWIFPSIRRSSKSISLSLQRSRGRFARSSSRSGSP
jgi:hypothetical protein